MGAQCERANHVAWPIGFHLPAELRSSPKDGLPDLVERRIGLVRNNLSFGYVHDGLSCTRSERDGGSARQDDPTTETKEHTFPFFKRRWCGRNRTSILA